MKKIVSLVLCLALVLALCTVAFAASYVSGKAYAVVDGKVAEATASPTDVKFVAADADEQTIAHYEIGGKTYVVVDKADDADYAVRSGSSWLYLEEADVEYIAEGELVGKTVKEDDATCKTFYQENAENVTGRHVASYVEDDETYYVVVKAGEEAEKYLLIGGKMYGILGKAKHAEHDWVYGYAEDKITVTGRSCPDCGKTQKAVSYNDWLLLAANKRNKDVENGYFEKGAAPAKDGKTSGVTSAKTFDAGVAMYAGLALMSVAGSAVVIGKKKEF